MARFDIPCLILDDHELKEAATLGEWRQDRYNLEAARIFGGATLEPSKRPSAFQRVRTPNRKPSLTQPNSLVSRIRTSILRIPEAASIAEHETRPTSVDAKNIIGLRPDIH